jgi:hypothetical protein
LQEVQPSESLKRQQRRREQPALQVAEVAVAKAKRERRKRAKAAFFETTESILPTASPASERATVAQQEFQSDL